ncbi:MAG: metallophosphoesterase [Oceanospirillaceae bacterium]|nr:metallophosphoesterase [Oceanospirillaceae bacterium]
MTRKIVFGDVHGHYDTLIRLIKKIGLDPWNLDTSTQFVFLGDLIDRGPDSASVVTYVKSLVDGGLLLGCLPRLSSLCFSL